MATPDITEITGLIDVGHLDDGLDELAAVVQERRAKVRKPPEPGDTVHFTDAVYPRYLKGLTATVVRVSDKSATVNMPRDREQYRKYSGARNIRCPREFIVELS